MRITLQDIPAADLQYELERRRLKQLKEEHLAREKVLEHVRRYREIFAALVELQGNKNVAKLLRDNTDLWGRYNVELAVYELQIPDGQDPFPWEKFERDNKVTL